MNRSFWTTLILTAGVCALIMGALATDNKRLSDRLATGPQAADQSPREQTPERPGKSKRTPTPPQSSEEKIERATEELTRFVALLATPPASELKPLRFNDSNGNRERFARCIEFWENLPVFLRAVEGLSVDELIAVAAKLPVVERDNSNWLSDPRHHLIMLAAEQDPMRVLQNEKLMQGIEQFWALRCLASVDPDEALRRLPDIVLPKDVDYKKKRERLGAILLGSDVDLGLQLLLKTRESDPDRKEGMQALNGGLKTGSIPLPPEAITGLVEAMNNPEYAAIRNDIIRTTLDHHLGESGVAQTARQARTMNLTPGEIGLYLDCVGEDLIATEPEATIKWMGDALNAEQQAREIPEAVVTWANLDIDSAADWLGRQEPSQVLDRAIAEFAKEASELDAEGATAWAREIQDDNMRDETLRKVENR